MAWLKGGCAPKFMHAGASAVVLGDAWPNPAQITISIVPDNTVLATISGNNIYSNLRSTFDAAFGTDVWEPVLFRAANMWAGYTDVNFITVDDNGAGVGSGSYQQGDPYMGDVRIGGCNLGSTVYCQSYFPPPVNNYSLAGDILFNTAIPLNIGSNPDLFTVAAHELGHTLGLGHNGVQASALMYYIYNWVKSDCSSDDKMAVRGIYSGGYVRANDAYWPNNNSFANAQDLTSLLSGRQATVQGLDIATSSSVEYFKVTAPSDTSSSIALRMQSSGISLLEPKLTVYASDQTTVLGSASSTGIGASVAVILSGITANQLLYLKCQGNVSSFLGQGLYGLTLNFASNNSLAISVSIPSYANGSPLHGGGGALMAGCRAYANGKYKHFHIKKVRHDGLHDLNDIVEHEHAW
jgi:hypothetical protein